ncbi:hypothetical protein DUNSADRAFT_18197 [Dunaliella salina]|uniref:Secreted protein n=1 Tax=Dunaliella salina TaxID=3046 RepID=A0ABQ7G0H8_DUNSA|nr:hypothetical protein DUNSADRAFT_18197 [Dunaliella salina]|eukprot:KAF5828104.1 hypothetical protein DUNSADRAFT_18197 [Dunaliella salina]
MYALLLCTASTHIIRGPVHGRALLQQQLNDFQVPFLAGHEQWISPTLHNTRPHMHSLVLNILAKKQATRQSRKLPG